MKIKEDNIIFNDTTILRFLFGYYNRFVLKIDGKYIQCIFDFNYLRESQIQRLHKFLADHKDLPQLT